MQQGSRNLLFLNIVLVSLSWGLALSSYPSLPDTIPTHFGFSGVPDGWGGRSLIFFLPGVQTGISILLFGIAYFIPRIPNSMLNFPGKEKVEKLTEESKKEIYQEVYAYIANFLFILALLLSSLFLFLLLTTIKVAFGEWQRLNPVANGFFLVLIFGAVAYFSIKMYCKVRYLVERG